MSGIALDKTSQILYNTPVIPIKQVRSMKERYFSSAPYKPINRMKQILSTRLPQGVISCFSLPANNRIGQACHLALFDIEKQNKIRRFTL